MAAKKKAKKTARKAAARRAPAAAPAKSSKASSKTASKASASKKASGKTAASKASSSKATASKATSSSVRQGDKAAFVRSLPRSLPASEVVEQAREHDLIISKAYVHNIRSAANKAARALMAKEGKKTIKGDKTKLESNFRELVIALGPARAKKLLSQVEVSLSLASQK